MSTNDQRPASHGGRPDPHETNDLRSYAERVAPAITVDISGVFRAARRRRVGQATAFTLVTALALGGGWAIAAQPWASPDPEILPGGTTTSAEPSAEASAEAELSEEAQEYLDAGYWRSAAEVVLRRGAEPAYSTRHEVWTVRDSFGMRIIDVARMEEDPNDSIEEPGLRLGLFGPIRWEDLYALPAEPEVLEACLFAGERAERARREAGEVKAETGEFGDVDYLELPEECRGDGSGDVVAEGRNSRAAVVGVTEMVADLLTAPSTTELRDSAWEVLTGLPGAQVDDAGEDSKGRSGTAVTFEVDERHGVRGHGTETYVYEATSRVLLEAVSDFEADEVLDALDTTITYLPRESGSYDAMPSDIRAVYDRGITEREANWNEEREGQIEREKRRENIEAWGLEDKEMTEEELNAAVRADLGGSESGFGSDELRGASLEYVLQDEFMSDFELEIHYKARDGVPPGMIWKAESPNGVPSDRLWLPEGGTIHLWVTPEP